jgi:hypothetical protein
MGVVIIAAARNRWYVVKGGKLNQGGAVCMRSGRRRRTGKEWAAAADSGRKKC